MLDERPHDVLGRESRNGAQDGRDAEEPPDRVGGLTDRDDRSDRSHNHAHQQPEPAGAELARRSWHAPRRYEDDGPGKRGQQRRSPERPRERRCKCARTPTLW